MEENNRLHTIGTLFPKASRILSGQFITTSAEVTPNGGLVRESPPKWPCLGRFWDQAAVSQESLLLGRPTLQRLETHGEETPRRRDVPRGVNPGVLGERRGPRLFGESKGFPRGGSNVMQMYGNDGFPLKMTSAK